MAEKCGGREERGSGGLFMAVIRFRVRDRQLSVLKAGSLSRDN